MTTAKSPARNKKKKDEPPPPLTWDEFLEWEHGTSDALDVKRVYFDVAGSHLAGLMLAQIVFWHLPDAQGKSKLRKERDGEWWLAKTCDNWKNELRLTERQVRECLHLLSALELIEVRQSVFAGKRTTLIRLNKDFFIGYLFYALDGSGNWELAKSILQKFRRGHRGVTSQDKRKKEWEKAREAIEEHREQKEERVTDDPSPPCGEQLPQPPSGTHGKNPSGTHGKNPSGTHGAPLTENTIKTTAETTFFRQHTTYAVGSSSNDDFAEARENNFSFDATERPSPSATTASDHTPPHPVAPSEGEAGGKLPAIVKNFTNRENEEVF